MPPYVALIDKTAWRVTQAERLKDLCSYGALSAQHLVVQDVDSSAFLRIFNVHIPTRVATPCRKETVARTLCDIATGTHHSGVAQPIATHGSGVAPPTVAQPTAAIPWVIVGDLNVDEGTMMKWCNSFSRARCRACLNLDGRASTARTNPM